MMIFLLTVGIEHRMMYGLGYLRGIGNLMFNAARNVQGYIDQEFANSGEFSVTHGVPGFIKEVEGSEEKPVEIFEVDIFGAVCDKTIEEREDAGSVRGGDFSSS